MLKRGPIFDFYKRKNVLIITKICYYKDLPKIENYFFILFKNLHIISFLLEIKSR